MSKKFIVTEELLAIIVNYLSTQPYKEVSNLLQALQLKEHVTEYTEPTVHPVPTQPTAQPAAQPVEDF